MNTPGISEHVAMANPRIFFLGNTIKSGWWFQIFVIFTPIPGEMIQFDEHIFQMGGSTTN